MKKVLISLFVLISLLLTGCQETSISNSISNSNESSEVVDSSTNDESSTLNESTSNEEISSSTISSSDDVDEIKEMLTFNEILSFYQCDISALEKIWQFCGPYQSVFHSYESNFDLQNWIASLDQEYYLIEKEEAFSMKDYMSEDITLIFPNKQLNFDKLTGINNLFICIIEGNYYISKGFVSYSGMFCCEIINLPDFVGDVEDMIIGEKRNYFIFEYLDLKEMFEYSICKEPTHPFNESMFDENFVLCIVYKDTYKKAKMYYNFEVDGLELSIQEKTIIIEETEEKMYIDFIIIPRELLPGGELNTGIEYYWK